MILSYQILYQLIERGISSLRISLVVFFEIIAYDNKLIPVNMSTGQ